MNVGSTFLVLGSEENVSEENCSFSFQRADAEAVEDAAFLFQCIPRLTKVLHQHFQDHGALCTLRSVGALAEDHLEQTNESHFTNVEKIEETLKALIVFCLHDHDTQESPVDFLTIKGKPVLRRQALLRDEGLILTVIKLLEMWAFKYQEAEALEVLQIFIADHKYLCQLCYRSVCGL